MSEHEQPPHDARVTRLLSAMTIKELECAMSLVVHYCAPWPVITIIDREQRSRLEIRNSWGPAWDEYERGKK